MHPLIRPVIAIVAALAVGAAAVLIGLHFAQPKSPATITAPILAPSVGKANSAVTGYATVAAPGSKGVDKGTQATIDALNRGSGLSDADAAHTVGDSNPAPAVGADDPCATGASADCPEGLHGSIAFDTFSTPADLNLFLATNESAGPLFTCSAPASGQGIEAITTSPADVTLHYWPQDDPTSVQTAVLHSQPGDADTWDAANTARGGYTHDLETFQHCGTLNGLRSVAYTVQATAIDVLFRISATKTLQFDQRGPAAEPSMLVLPIGANKLYVSVPSTPTPLPDVRAWVVPAGTAPDCSTYTSATRLLSVEPQQVLSIDTGALLRAHLDPTFTKRTVDVFSAPEGSTIVVCARWFDHAGPTWNATSPQKQRSVVAHSPDALTPIVFFDSYTLNSGVPQYAFNIFASTVNGVSCGTDGLFPSTANQKGSRSGDGRQLCIENGRVDYGIAGDITITVRYHNGVTNSSTSSVLPISRLECLGVCALPLESHFQVPVSTDRGVVGSAHLTVRWQQGNQSGRSRWGIGDVGTAAPGAPTSTAPLFDTSTVVTASVASDGWSANAAFTIRSDRHTHYRASIADECSQPGAVTSAEGETTGSGQVWNSPLISFSGLCTDRYYVTTVVLTDDAGHTTTADVNQHDTATYWNGGAFVSPTDHIRITGTVAAVQAQASGRLAWKFDSLQQSLGGFSPNYPTIPSACQPVRSLQIPVTISETVDKAHQVHIVYSGTVAEEGLYYGTSHDADCSWPDPTRSTARVDQMVSLEDLESGIDITVPFTYTFPSGTITSTTYAMRVHLSGVVQR